MSKLRGITALTLAGSLASALVVAACETNTTDDPSTPDASAVDVSAPDSGSPGEAGVVLEVDCSHPGKGKPLPNGKCECPVLYDMNGTWNGKYDCKETAQNTCFDRDLTEEFKFVQTGNEVKTDDPSSSFFMEGILCGDKFVWTGGMKTGEYVECGTLTLLDANHYVKDSCYNNATDAGPSTCTPSYEQACPGQTGICTNSGARAPEAAPEITNQLCKQCNPNCP